MSERPRIGVMTGLLNELTDTKKLSCGYCRNVAPTVTRKRRHSN